MVSRAARGGVPHRALRRPRRGVVLRAAMWSLAGSVRCSVPDALACGLRGLLLGEHPARLRLPGLPAALEAPPHRDGLLQRDVPQARRHAARSRRWTSRRRPPASASRPSSDLSWKDLLDGFTCTECGRCQDACPAWATGKPLNPKTMIMGIREMAVEAEQGVPLLPFIRGAGSAGARPARARAPIVGTAITVRRGLGLRHVRRLRGGVPGASSSTWTRSSGCAATWSWRRAASRPS